MPQNMKVDTASMRCGCQLQARLQQCLANITVNKSEPQMVDLNHLNN